MRRAKPSRLRQAALTVGSVLIVMVGLALASALFMVLLVVGAVVGAWWWWKLRRSSRHVPPSVRQPIEGEYHVIETTMLPQDTRLPGTPSPSRPDSRPQ